MFLRTQRTLANRNHRCASAGLAPHDTEATVARINDHLLSWLQETKPPGILEMRYHNADLLDSFFAFKSNGDELAVWDISFGADIGASAFWFSRPRKGSALIWPNVTSVFGNLRYRRSGMQGSVWS